MIDGEGQLSTMLNLMMTIVRIYKNTASILDNRTYQDNKPEFPGLPSVLWRTDGRARERFRQGLP